MLYLLTHDQNYVSEENITAFMEWYENTRRKINEKEEKISFMDEKNVFGCYNTTNNHWEEPEYAASAKPLTAVPSKG